jgi:hypothetical protein
MKESANFYIASAAYKTVKFLLLLLLQFQLTKV